MDVLSKDERTVYVFALRYSFGRRTYAFGVVADELKKKLNSFCGYELQRIMEDINTACSFHTEWRNDNALEIASLKEAIYKELEKRE